MSNMNYSLKNKGVRLVSASDAWVKGKKLKKEISPRDPSIGFRKLSSALTDFYSII